MINATFVSVSAPNLRYETFNESHVNAALKTSLLAPIRTDIKFNNPKNNCLILGAWGCGAYRNDPTAMSEYMKDVALRYGGYYDKIIFAIPDGPDGNYEIFKQTIC